jgi:hypothetical protein
LAVEMQERLSVWSRKSATALVAAPANVRSRVTIPV